MNNRKNGSNGENSSDKIKSFGIFLILFAGIFIGCGKGLCDTGFEPCNVAVVDYDKIAKSTQKYVELKKYQEKKSKELQEFMRAARENTAIEKDPLKKLNCRKNITPNIK